MSSMMDEDAHSHDSKDEAMAVDEHPSRVPPSSSSPRSSSRPNAAQSLGSPAANHVLPQSFPSSPSSSLDQRVNSFRAACLDCLIGHQTHHLIPHSSKVIIFDSKLKVQHAFDGLVTHDINCFPSLDTRVLTDRGFLFLEQIEQRMDAGEEVLYACYDRASKALVYRPGDIVFDHRPPAQLVSFTSQDKAVRWGHDSRPLSCPVGGDLSGTHAALRVTPQHVMYAQVGDEDESGFVHYETTRPRLPSGKPGQTTIQPPAKRTARSLLSTCHCPPSTQRCEHRVQHTRMLACAEAGIAPTAAALHEARAEQRKRRARETAVRGRPNVRAAEMQLAADAAAAEKRRARRWAEMKATLSVANAVGLRSASHWAAFLEVLGFWIGDGVLESSALCDDGRKHKSVRFGLRKGSDRAWLRSALRDCGLPDEEVSSSTAGSHLEAMAVTNLRWFAWFDFEFGVESSASRDCDPSFKLHRQIPSTPITPASSVRRASASARCRHSWEADDEHIDETIIDVDWEEPPSQKHRTSVQAGQRTVKLLGSDDDVDGLLLTDDDEEDSAAPLHFAKRLPQWLILRLTADELRLFVRGLQRANGSSWQEREKFVWTANADLRDQLIHVLLHCGWSAYTQLAYPAGTIRGYKCSDPASDSTCTTKQYARMSEAQRSAYLPIRARADCWAVVWNDLSDAPNRRRSCPSFKRQRDVTTEPYDRHRDGRLWCVDVYHADHLIIAQRAHSEGGLVTRQSRPVLVGNCAPVWDSTRRKYVGLLSVSDFLDILLATAGDADRTAFLSLSSQRLCDWAEFKRRRGTSINRLLCISPESTLHEAVRQLLNYRVHRLCVVQLALADTILRILSNHGILRFLRQSCPQFAHVSIRDLGIGVFENLVTLTPSTPISRAMEMLSQYRVSSIPVVDASNRPVDVYSRSDIRYLAADANWTNLDLTIEAALAPHQPTRTLPLCTRDDNLMTVSGLLVSCNKHSLICVNAQTNVIEGVVSLTDIFSFILDSGPPRAESRIAALRADLDRGEDVAGGGGMLVVEGGSGAASIGRVDRSASGSPAGEDDLEMGDAPDIPPEEDFTS